MSPQPNNPLIVQSDRTIMLHTVISLTDDAGRPLYPVVLGGERQREMAFRFGVNLIMYTLTGNYKADQVHLPAILKRLGK